MAGVRRRNAWFAVVFALAVCANAEPTVVRFDLNPPYFNAVPASWRVLQIQPLTPFRGNLLTYTSDASGLVFVSNLWVGSYEGRVLPRGTASEIRFTFSVTATNLGIVNAHEITSVVGAPTYPVSGATAWSIQASDARYARAGTVGAAGITNALPPLERQNQTITLTNVALNELTTNTITGPLRIGGGTTQGELRFWEVTAGDHDKIITVDDGGFYFNNDVTVGALIAQSSIFSYLGVTAPNFIGGLTGASNATPSLATNSTAPDGAALLKSGNRLRLTPVATNASPPLALQNQTITLTNATLIGLVTNRLVADLDATGRAIFARSLHLDDSNVATVIGTNGGFSAGGENILEPFWGPSFVLGYTNVLLESGRSHIHGFNNVVTQSVFVGVFGDYNRVVAPYAYIYGAGNQYYDTYGDGFEPCGIVGSGNFATNQALAVPFWVFGANMTNQIDQPGVVIGFGTNQLRFTSSNVTLSATMAADAFLGSAHLLTNATPALATNSASAKTNDLLVHSGDRLKFVDPWSLEIERALKPKYIILCDEFIGGANSDGTIGELGWRTIGGSVGNFGQGWGTNRPGVRILYTGTSVSNYYGITHYSPDWNQGLAVMSSISNWLMQFEFRLPEALTNGQIVIGVSQGSATPTWLNPGLGFFLFATNMSGPFMFVNKVGSTWAISNSTVNVDLNWHTLKITYTNEVSGQPLWFSLDDEPPVRVGSLTGLGGGSGYSPYVAVTTGEAAAKRLAIDRFCIVSTAR